jgi:hypothetical protein
VPEEVEFGRGVHLDRGEALIAPRAGGGGNVVRPVAADPRIGADRVADASAQQLPCGQAIAPALQIPQGLVEARQRRHQHRAAAIEAAPVTDLPDVLDPSRVLADEPVPQRLERAVDRLREPLKTRFAPAERAVLGLDSDEEPPRRHRKGLDARDLHAASVPRKGRRLLLPRGAAIVIL